MKNCIVFEDKKRNWRSLANLSCYHIEKLENEEDRAESQNKINHKKTKTVSIAGNQGKEYERSLCEIYSAMVTRWGENIPNSFVHLKRETI